MPAFCSAIAPNAGVLLQLPRERRPLVCYFSALSLNLRYQRDTKCVQSPDTSIASSSTGVELYQVSQRAVAERGMPVYRGLMAIKFGKEQETTLIVGIVEGLQSTNPQYQFLVSSDFKWADKLLNELNDDNRGRLERHIGERSLSTFLISEIETKRRHSGDSKKLDTSKPLSQIDFLSNTLSAARDLVSALAKIPHRYRLTAATPKAFSDPLLAAGIKSLEFPGGIYLASGDSLPGDLPVRSEVAAIDRHLFTDWSESVVHERDWQADRMYFTAPIVGYADESSSGPLGRQLEDYITAFFGASTALAVTSYGYEDKADFKPYFTVHHEQGRNIIKTERLNDRLMEKGTYTSTKAFCERHGHSAASKMSDASKRIGTIFLENLDCRKLFSACIWFYRAKLNPRPLDALLQATISIEVMLGDRKAAEGIGLTNLLSNRCAYLLGRSSKHRSEIAERFRRVYDLRSEIVHEGRHVEKIGDRAVVAIAYELCASIITRELQIRSNAAG